MIGGILACRTSASTSVYNVVTAARASGNEKPIIFMGGRDDHYTQQVGIGMLLLSLVLTHKQHTQ